MIVLDTHALIWWVNGDDLLSDKAKKLIDKTIKNNKEIIISSISVWEIAMLTEQKRLLLSIDINKWINEVSAIKGVRFHPVDNEIAIKSALFPGELHKDPADRIIIATARLLAAPLITADKKIHAYKHVKTAW